MLEEISILKKDLNMKQIRFLYLIFLLLTIPFASSNVVISINQGGSFNTVLTPTKVTEGFFFAQQTPVVQAITANILRGSPPTGNLPTIEKEDYLLLILLLCILAIVFRLVLLDQEKRKERNKKK